MSLVSTYGPKKIRINIPIIVMLLWLLFWFVPTSVRSQIGRTIEDFVALGAPIFHVDNHRASAIERKEKVIILLLQKPLLQYNNMCAVCYVLFTVR